MEGVEQGVAGDISPNVDDTLPSLEQLTTFPKPNLCRLQRMLA